MTVRSDPRSSSVGRYQETLQLLGYELGGAARILDLGCGAGATVYQFRDAGYDAYGFDVKDYLELRAPEDRGYFQIGLLAANRLPYDENQFDLIISEQVIEHVKDQRAFFDELHRVLKPGGLSLHTFPAYWTPIEPHIYVPFGHLMVHYWWFYLWALLGVRNEFQKGLSARETARRNCVYAVEALYYVPNSVYSVLWADCGLKVSWFDNENLRSGPRAINRLIGHIDRRLPLLSATLRNFLMRRVCLSKPNAEPDTSTPAQSSVESTT